MHLLSPSANNGSRIIKSLFPRKDDRPQLVICHYVMMINSDKINLYLLNRILLIVKVQLHIANKKLPNDYPKPVFLLTTKSILYKQKLQ